MGGARPDGRFTATAAAHRTRPDIAAAVLASAAHRIPASLLRAYQAGRPFLLDEIRNDWLVEAAADAEDLAARRRIAAQSVLVVPLLVAGRLLGAISFTSTDHPRVHTDEDLALAEELGRRVAGMIEADRVTTREQHLHTATIALAAAATTVEAAAALAAAISAATGAAGIAVYHHRSDTDQLDLVHTSGYPPQVAAAFAAVYLGDPLPAADAARTGNPIWLGDQHSWQRHYPGMAVEPADADAHAVAAVPLQVGGRLVGVLAASYPTAREFPPDEQQFTLTLVTQAAQAFERAAIADTRWQLARTLQQGLLPPTLPLLPRLVLAARYLPAADGVQAGGDWYDVLDLGEHRVAIAVGDVVGQGPAAAAVMGQLRSALNAYLLDDHPPGAAVDRLNRFALRIPGARASSAICLILDTDTGELVWARAGHPPPLIVGPGGARYLDGAHGMVLGLTSAPAPVQGHTTLLPGSALLLYTDGLVERRGEVIDDGLDRLAATADRHRADPPDALIDAALAAALDGAGPADDIAVIVARLLPAPLHQQLPAHPAQISAVRRAARVWAATAGLPDELTDDLQLLLNEAVTNTVEHGYLDRTAGQFTYHLERSGDLVHVQVADHGAWRPIPTDPGHRGRGLALIHALAGDVTLDATASGTRIRFTLPIPPPSTGQHTAAAPPLRTETQPDVSRDPTSDTTTRSASTGAASCTNSPSRRVRPAGSASSRPVSARTRARSSRRCAAVTSRTVPTISGPRRCPAGVVSAAHSAQTRCPSR